jgi:hypothetical protein
VERLAPKHDDVGEELIPGHVAHAGGGGSGVEARMCLWCATGSDGQRLVRRAHVLQLLTLVEHPNALPVEAALRLAQEVLEKLAEAERSERQCDLVAPPGPDIARSR